MKDKFLYNARRTGSIRASRIRNFTIEKDEQFFLVTAWINDDESVKMGLFETEPEAQTFLDSLHSEIENIG